MARPKKEIPTNTTIDLNNDFFSELTKDTDFAIADKGSLMHSRNKVTTPLTVLNCIWGGGIPLGIMSEVSGPYGSGKSTFLYQCMANYQKEYPNGVSVILDMEASMDNDRLEALGVDTSKVLRLPSVSMEKAFGNLFKVLEKLSNAIVDHPDLSAFIIYDSLAAQATESEQKAAKNGESTLGAGTMREDTRTLKHNLNNILPYMEKFPIFIGLINQVMVKPNPYGGPAKVESGGGNALKHLCHTHIVFGSSKDTYEDMFLTGTESKVELHKSKLSPKMINISCQIDVTKGGKIDETDSFVKYLTEKSIGFINTGAWYQFGDYLKETMFMSYPQLASQEELKNLLTPNYRKDSMYDLISNNKDLFNFLQIALIDFLCKIYPAQQIITESYKDGLIKDCKYFSNTEI